MKEHRAPWECIYAKEDKSRCKSGKKPRSDQEYFEILCLYILQSGLSWGVVRKYWKRYKASFLGFDIDRLAEAKPDALMKRAGVIRNRKKVEGIIHNAREFQRIRQECDSFSSFLRTCSGMKKRDVMEILIKRFKHVGEYTAEFYLHSVGYG